MQVSSAGLSVNHYRKSKQTMFKWLRNRAEKRRRANNLYSLAANHARHPNFYQSFQVPDSITGRSELLCIHIYLLLERLRSESNDDELSQMLTEVMVKELERAYRDSGFRDLAIPKNIKRLVAGFYERAGAYKAGIRQGNRRDLAEAINHYVYTGATTVDARAENLTNYMLGAYSALSQQRIKDIENSSFTFITPEID